MKNNGQRHICVGLLAHVDAGKTTLSEAMLYTCGMIRSLGRVDHRDAFLDTYALERERGITIFSKQAVLQQGTMTITLLDTPGHVDFSAEMERTLQVLDYAVLVISAADGVQGHTRTLWKLLERYGIPVFLFVNKMDQPGADRESLRGELQSALSSGCVDFEMDSPKAFYEEAALCDEALLEEYLETGEIGKESLRRCIAERKLFPCYFGSALHLEGVDRLMQGLEHDTICPTYGTEFGARVFKVMRDADGVRLTYMKLLGGTLHGKERLRYLPGKAAHVSGERELLQEKADQLRIYSGERYETVDSVEAGRICAVTGLTGTYPGQGLGNAEDMPAPMLEPVLTYRLLLPPDVSPAAFLPKLRMVEEEDPTLHVLWQETLQEIQLQVMGEVQLEILKALLAERFDVRVSFDEGKIVYRETIRSTVEGVGHFEPLRHYAEVHLILEPGEPGSGMQYLSVCGEQQLAQNWQRLILTHLEEKTHRGVLTGAELTDVRILVAGGRAHLKHTEGGDFRQATYRAVRQGLMQAESVLLEPCYDFVLEVPAECVGRAMTDLSQRKAEVSPPEIGASAVLRGRGPVSALRAYAREVASYTGGRGSFSCVVSGYVPCHNAQEVIAQTGYDPETDAANPTGSVFCSHGAGFYVPWDKVSEYMHIENILPDAKSALRTSSNDIGMGQIAAQEALTEHWMGTEEIDAILERASGANRKQGFTAHKGISRPNRKREIPAQVREYGKQPHRLPTANRERYLLVDGYNIIFAWKELQALARENIDSARGRLLDLMCDYQGIKKCHLIVVFDAYRVQGHPTEAVDYHNIHVVYTREAETADQFIERFAHENAQKYDVTVATSDGLEQIIIRGQGCGLISAREFERETAAVKKQVQQTLEEQRMAGNTLYDNLSEHSRRELGQE